MLIDTLKNLLLHPLLGCTYISYMSTILFNVFWPHPLQQGADKESDGEGGLLLPQHQVYRGWNSGGRESHMEWRSSRQGMVVIA